MPGRSDDLDPLENRAYDLLFHEDMSDEEVTNRLAAALRDKGQNEMLAGMAVAEAHSYRHQQALRGELDWISWMAAVARRPAESGTDVLVLALVSALLALLVVLQVGTEMRNQPGAKVVLYLLSFGVGSAIFLVGSYPLFAFKNKRSKAGQMSSESPHDPDQP